jgi:hypothetical protein
VFQHVRIQDTVDTLGRNLGEIQVLHVSRDQLRVMRLSKWTQPGIDLHPDEPADAKFPKERAGLSSTAAHLKDRLNPWGDHRHNVITNAGVIIKRMAVEKGRPDLRKALLGLVFRRGGRMRGARQSGMPCQIRLHDPPGLPIFTCG